MYRMSILVSAVILGIAPVIAAAPENAPATSEWAYSTLADESVAKPTALLVGGRGRYAELTDEQMSTAFGGLFADYERVNVPFPGTPNFRYSIEVGAQNLYEAVNSTPGVKLIGAVSEGGPTVYAVLRRLMDDPARPGDDQLAAFVYGYPNRGLFLLGGTRYIALPKTPYDVVTVAAEYDGIADFPDNWLNPFAVMNAVMGALELHVTRAFLDIRTTPTKFVEVTNDLGGTTTHVLIPTDRLPLLTPWLAVGFAPEFVSFLDRLLRPIVDSAYFRPDMTVGIPAALRPPPTDPPPSTEDAVGAHRTAPLGQSLTTATTESERGEVGELDVVETGRVVETDRNVPAATEPAASAREDRPDVKPEPTDAEATSGDADVEADPFDRDRDSAEPEEGAGNSSGDNDAGEAAVARTEREGPGPDAP